VNAERAGPPAADRDGYDAAIRQVEPSRVTRWLQAGARDFVWAFVPSSVWGLALALFGIGLLAVGWSRPWLLAGAFSGFLLVAPLLATGVYELSRRHAAGEPLSFDAFPGALRRGGPCLLRFGTLLAAVGTVWVAVSALVVAGIVHAPAGLEAFVRELLLAPLSWPFLLWLLAGALLAALVFAATAVSLPLLLDRDVPMRTAIAISVEAVSANPVTMATWAALIMLVTGIGLVTLMGLAVVLPVLAHASWHAYRDLVDADAFPDRGARNGSGAGTGPGRGRD